jgi:hypothetical protein
MIPRFMDRFFLIRNESNARPQSVIPMPSPYPLSLQRASPMVFSRQVDHQLLSSAPYTILQPSMHAHANPLNVLGYTAAGWPPSIGTHAYPNLWHFPAPLAIPASIPLPTHQASLIPNDSQFRVQQTSSHPFYDRYHSSNYSSSSPVEYLQGPHTLLPDTLQAQRLLHEKSSKVSDSLASSVTSSPALQSVRPPIPPILPVPATQTGGDMLQFSSETAEDIKTSTLTSALSTTSSHPFRRKLGPYAHPQYTVLIVVS